MHMLFCCLAAFEVALVYGIIIQGTLKSIYYELSEKQHSELFSILDYTDRVTATRVISILKNRSFPMQTAYNKQLLSLEQARDMVDAFFAEKSIHHIALPSKLVFRNPSLADVLQEMWSEYQFKVLHITSSFKPTQTHWFRGIVESAMDAPETCGNIVLVDFACKFDLHRPWIYFRCRQNLSRYLDFDYELLAISMLISDRGLFVHSLRTAINSLKYTGYKTDNRYFNKALNDILNLCNTKQALNSALETVKQKTHLMSAPQKALWHLKLLLLAILPPGPTPDRNFNRKIPAEVLVENLIIFFDEHAVENVPPVLMRVLINSINKYLIRLPKTVSPSLHSKLSYIDQLFPSRLGFWGDFSNYIHKWKLSLAGVGAYSPPHSACGWIDACKHWGFGLAMNAFIANEFTRPFVLLYRDGSRLECRELEHFLVAFSSILIEESGALCAQKDGMILVSNDSLPPSIWAAISRIIIFSFFYFDGHAIKLSMATWERIYQAHSGANIAPSGPEKFLASFLGHANFLSAVPLELLAQSIS